MTRFILLCLLLTVVFSEDAAAQKRVRQGYWHGELELEEHVKMPFRFYYHSKNNLLEIHNSSEIVTLDFHKMEGDTAIYSFPTYHTYVSIYKKSCGKVAGAFIHKDRKTKGKINFQATFSGQKKKFKASSTPHNVSGKWQVSFDAYQKGEYPAIGVFEQEKNGRLTGTFMTETGDYRFLEGRMDGDKFFLSGLGGAQVFYMEAQMINGNLFGTFYSGKHHKNKWIAMKNEQFELMNPYEKTFVTSDDPITFEKPNLDGINYHFPNDETSGKVIILQILGSWCPNCLDETLFLKTLHEKYADDGLEIIALGYEIPDNFAGQRDRLLHYVNKLGVTYTVLVGGNASKKETASDFPTLNNIFSYPTTIFINRAGDVVHIHTGFNGPGTGEVYKQYAIDTEKKIQKLLNE